MRKSKNVHYKSNLEMNKKKLAMIAIPVLILVLAFEVKSNLQVLNKTKEDPNTIKVFKDSDLVIQINQISDTATYYPVEINGTNLEVLAVKAPDGTIRTAFNTCQVCFNSGRGYYSQQGNYLICQNCGNRFGLSEVEVTRGGCNPVPITSEEKIVNKSTITISKDYLETMSVIFQNWKR